MNDELKVEGINRDGFGIIPKLVMQDRELNINCKAIYAYFCSFAGAGTQCFPTRKKICYDMGISNDTLGKYLNMLVNRGYISCVQAKEKGKFSHNIYTLSSTTLPCPKTSDTESTEYGNLDTKNNNTKNNNIYNNNKEDIKKENKQKKEMQKGSFDKIIAEYTDDAEIKDLIGEWLKVRKMKKAVLTDRALRMNLEKLNRLAQESNMGVADYLQEVIMRGWTAFYQIKNYNNNSGKQQFGSLDNAYDKSGNPIWDAHNNITADEFIYRLNNNAATFVKGIDVMVAFEMLWEYYPRQENKTVSAMAFFDYVKENPKAKIVELAINIDACIKYCEEDPNRVEYCYGMKRFIEEMQNKRYDNINCNVRCVDNDGKGHFYETKEEYEQAIISGEIEMYCLPRSCITF